jgi:hypothetical protein
MKSTKTLKGHLNPHHYLPLLGEHYADRVLGPDYPVIPPFRVEILGFNNQPQHIVDPTL